MAQMIVVISGFDATWKIGESENEFWDISSLRICTGQIQSTGTLL
jgi:hypothetical protein